MYAECFLIIVRIFSMEDGFEDGWAGFLFLLIGLARIWPVVLVMVVGLVILRRYLKRLKKRREETRPPSFPTMQTHSSNI